MSTLYFVREVILVSVFFISMIVAGSVVFDFYTGKVPNKLMLAAYLFAPLLIIVDYGIASMPTRLACGLVSGVILFTCYMCRAIGAGDVKLMTFICIFLSFQNIFKFIFLVFCIGAVMGVLKVAMKVIDGKTELSAMRIKFTIPITIGYMIVIASGG